MDADRGGAGRATGRDADGRTDGRTRPRGRAAPTPPPARQQRQPEPGLDGDEDYDWYRYLSHGGSPPSQRAAEADTAGRAAGYADPRDDRPGPAPRTARKKNRDERKDRDESKNRAERKSRRDRKKRGADDSPLTERRPRSGADGPADTASGWGEDQEAAYTDPAGTSPGRGGQAYPGPATAQPTAGGADPASTSPGHPRQAYPGGPAAHQPGPGYAHPAVTGPGHGWPSYPGGSAAQPGAGYPDPAAGPAGTSPGRGWQAYQGPATAQLRAGYADPAADPTGTGPGQGWRTHPAPAAHPGRDYADSADTGPGHGWQTYPGAAAAQPGYTDAGYGQPPYPGPAMPRPVPAGPYDQPGGGQHPGMHPAWQPYAPADDGPAGSVADDNDSDSEPSRPARRSAKRDRKALRSPSARAVRRAVHPDVLERANFVAAAGAGSPAARLIWRRVDLAARLIAAPAWRRVLIWRRIPWPCVLTWPNGQAGRGRQFAQTARLAPDNQFHLNFRTVPGVQASQSALPGAGSGATAGCSGSP
jgi:hypothetical protein